MLSKLNAKDRRRFREALLHKPDSLVVHTGEDIIVFSCLNEHLKNSMIFFKCTEINLDLAHCFKLATFLNVHCMMHSARYMVQSFR